MSKLLSFLATEDGGLTTAGTITSAILFFLLLVLAAVFAGRKKKFSVKQLTFCALAIALATALSVYPPLPKLPQGGSITLFSMFFVTLIGYWYGPAVGLMCGIAYGLIQMILGPYIVSIPQLLFDYPFAFGALGLSGFLANRKHGLISGYLLGITGRFIFSTLSGVVFFADYAPEGMNPWIYSMGYNASYIYLEGVLTVVLLLIPAISKALRQIKTIALED